MQQHGSKYFTHSSPHPAPPSPTLRGFIWNHECSSMVAIILPAAPPPPPPPTLGVGSKGHFIKAPRIHFTL